MCLVKKKIQTVVKNIKHKSLLVHLLGGYHSFQSFVCYSSDVLILNIHAYVPFKILYK